MARTCDICGKGSLKGHHVSHSNIKTVRRQKVNLQAKTIDSKKQKVCSTCARTLKKPAKKTVSA